MATCTSSKSTKCCGVWYLRMWHNCKDVSSMLISVATLPANVKYSGLINCMPLQSAAYQRRLVAIMTPSRHSKALFQCILRSRTGPAQVSAFHRSCKTCRSSSYYVCIGLQFAAAWQGSPASNATSTLSLSTSSHSSFSSQSRNQRLGQVSHAKYHPAFQAICPWQPKLLQRNQSHSLLADTAG